MTDRDWNDHAFPSPRVPYGLIDVGDGHRLFGQEFGNPHGEPMIVLHGGPGGGCDTRYARYFDPGRYRVIMFDQRGCLNSTPTTHTDLQGAMKGNNTARLVEDINKVREHFGIRGKMHLEGGSWGSTLALAYAIKHATRVRTLILRGVFLGDPSGMNYLFQGNAAHYEEALRPPDDASTPDAIARFMDAFNRQRFEDIEGAYRAYLGDGSLPGQIPARYHARHRHMAIAYARAWDELVRVIPKPERSDLIGAYCRILEATPGNEKEKQHQQRCAFAFAQWEDLISYFEHEPSADGRIALGKSVDGPFALDFARLEARYTRDGFYLSEDGSPSAGGSDYLIENLHRIAMERIPILIAHGLNDQVCSVRDAYRLKDAYDSVLRDMHGPHGWTPVHLDCREETGHSMLERGNTLALLEIIRNRVPPMSSPEREGEPATAS
jgi:proline iminopeptidase